MTVQIANEDSAFFTFGETQPGNPRYPYLEEIKRRFNQFLLAKYGTRKQLKAAWTFENQCGLEADEDPEAGAEYLHKCSKCNRCVHGYR